jgi:hypothetical protein
VMCHPAQFNSIDEPFGPKIDLKFLVRKRCPSVCLPSAIML